MRLLRTRKKRRAEVLLNERLIRRFLCFISPNELVSKLEECLLAGASIFLLIFENSTQGTNYKQIFFYKNWHWYMVNASATYNLYTMHDARREVQCKLLTHLPLLSLSDNCLSCSLALAPFSSAD